VYRARRQRFGYAAMVPPALACLYGLAHKYWVLVGGAALAVVLTALWVWAELASCEYAVTNKRVIVKIGTLQRRTVEIMLSKVEGVSVDQTLLGRLANSGTVIITGTGGTREAFEQVADPLEFRRQVQGQVSRLEDERLQAIRGA
jgi:uncharacterized membrane protein YdbT with pleckstrin-like domain